MNERIQELAKQARQYAIEKIENSQDPAEWSTAMFEQKFAELIVGECAEFVRYKAEKAMSQEILYVGNDLLNHFGVE